MRVRFAPWRRSAGAAGWLLAGALLAQGPALAQEGAAEHQAHHPAAAPSDAATQEGEASPGSVTNGMKAMMEHGGGSSNPLSLYPRVLSLADLTQAQRLELRQAAERRVHSAERTLDAAHVQLVGAMDTGDHGAAQAALRQAREAIGRLESGVSAHRLAVEEAGKPQQAALDWLRADLGIARDPIARHGLFGLTWFHYLVMGTILASALLLAVIHRHKRRRALLLLDRLSREGTTAGSGPAAIPGPEPARIGSAVQPPRPAAFQGQGAAGAAPAAAKFNVWTGSLAVTRIFDEVPGVKTFRLVDPAGGELPFRYLPGQFLTLTVPVAGQTVKRSYTIASSPAQPFHCEITVRHEAGGLVSGYLHEQVKAGQLLQVTAPSGKFTFAGEDGDSIVLIAGGVGVTPMMGVIRYLTDRSWPGEVFLVYGCKTQDGFIFRPEIEHLTARHPNLHATFIAEQADPARWPHAIGRITADLLAAAVPGIAGRHVHLCGPKPMMEAVKPMLAQLGVPDRQVETEVFVGKERPVPAPTSVTVSPAGVQATATFARSGKSASLPPSKTILEAAEDIGVEIEYSCRSGVCGACKVKLLSGTVSMEVQDGLTGEDQAQNMVLACQAKASTDVTVDA